jgi:hypothetical protein
VQDEEQGADGKRRTVGQPWCELFPAPAVHANLTAFAAFAATNEDRATVAVKVGPAARLRLDTGWGGVTVPDGMTTREKLHIIVDELTDGEAEAALARLSRERELLRQWTGSTDTAVAEDEWALANAREAIREERW